MVNKLGEVKVSATTISNFSGNDSQLIQYDIQSASRQTEVNKMRSERHSRSFIEADKVKISSMDDWKSDGSGGGYITHQTENLEDAEMKESISTRLERTFTPFKTGLERDGMVVQQYERTE